MRLLAIAIGSTVLSTAFVVSLSIIPTEAEYAQDIRGVNQRYENGQYVTVSTEHQNSGSHVAPFATRNDDINQTEVTEVRIALYNLWVEHVVWTRQYIVAAAGDHPDASFAAERLMKNQEDIGNAIKLFYGEQAGNQLTSQLKDYILIAVDLIEATKAGNSTAVEEIERKWYANADEIATFLVELIQTGQKRICRTCSMNICLLQRQKQLPDSQATMLLM
jgi:hypothetical protein